MDKSEIIKLIQDTVSELTSNATSPHRHNGVDSLQVTMTDVLILPGVGIPFANGAKQFNMYIMESFTGGEALVIEPSTSFVDAAGVNTAQMYIGKSTAFEGTQFGQIFSLAKSTEAQVRISLQTEASDTGTASVFDVNATTIDATTDVARFFPSATGTFAVLLPDAPRPAPVAGMLAFESGVFYACEVTGTWRTLVTA